MINKQNKTKHKRKLNKIVNNILSKKEIVTIKRLF